MLLVAVRIGAALLVLLVLGACGGEGGPEYVGHDARGDLHYIGNKNPWEFMDILRFGARPDGDSVEGWIQFRDKPKICPHCVFTIEFAMRGEYVVAEVATTFEHVDRRQVWIRLGSDDPYAPETFVSDDYHVKESGDRFEFRLPVKVLPGAMMSVRSFHDEGGGESVKALDVTETPLRIG